MAIFCHVAVMNIVPINFDQFKALAWEEDVPNENG